MSAGGVGSLDDLIRSQQQRRRDGEAECPGGLEVDDRFELRGLLDGEIGRLGALEDLVHVGGGTPEEIRQARPVPHESPGLHKLACTGSAPHCRQPALHPKVYEADSVNKEQRVCQDDESADLSSTHGGECDFKIVWTSRRQALKLQSQGLGCDLRLSQKRPGRWISRNEEDGYLSDLGDGLLEQLNRFAGYLGACCSAHAGDVSPRPCETGDETALNGVSTCSHDDGDRLRSILSWLVCGRSTRNDDVDLETNEVGREGREAFEVAVGPSVLDDEVLSLNPAQFA